MALTEADKERARHHLGYMGVQQSSTFVMGVPAGVQTQFMIEASWDRLLASSYPRFRKLLDRMDALEEQIVDNSENVEAESIGDIVVGKRAFAETIKRYKLWQASVANMLGIQPNPFDQRFSAWSGGGGINVRVAG